jgi:hypothetical protein
MPRCNFQVHKNIMQLTLFLSSYNGVCICCLGIEVLLVKKGTNIVFFLCVGFASLIAGFFFWLLVEQKGF